MMNRDHTFSPADADAITHEYVCAVCFHDLEIIPVPGEFERMIVCPIHGDCTVVGRVTRATVSIQNENESLQFQKAVDLLADLFPELKDAGTSRETALKLQHTNVCSVCGGLLQVSATDSTFTSYELKCRRHPGGGYLRKDKFKYDFQTMKNWEREHKTKG